MNQWLQYEVEYFMIAILILKNNIKSLKSFRETNCIISNVCKHAGSPRGEQGVRQRNSCNGRLLIDPRGLVLQDKTELSFMVVYLYSCTSVRKRSPVIFAAEFSLPTNFANVFRRGRNRERQFSCASLLNAPHNYIHNSRECI